MLRYGFFDSEIIGYDEEGMPEFDRAESSDFLAMFISRIISDGVLAAPSTCFQVLAGGGMKLKLQPGFGIVRGHFAYSDEEIEIVLDPAPKSYRRIDRIILRLNNLERMCEIVKLTGTPDSVPQPPELIRPAAGDYYELCLATVSVNSNQTEISQANITDTRADSRVCGFVTQVIDHIDTSVFYAQFEQFYREFVERSNSTHAEWEAQFERFYNAFAERSDETYERWVTAMREYLQGLQTSGNGQLEKIVEVFEAFKRDAEAAFLAWFQNIRDQLGEDPAGHLQNQIDTLTGEKEQLEKRLALLEGYLLTGRMEAPLVTEDGTPLITEDRVLLKAVWPICGCKNICAR